MAKKKKKAGGQLKAKRHVSLAPTPWGGDHGTGTKAATKGTLMRGVEDEKGANPNNIGQRYRVEVIDTLDLTVRQKQAAQAIRNAFCAVESLSSGGPLKEKVQASPKPDATIDAQVDAMSRFKFVMDGVRRQDRAIVEHVCFENKPLRLFKAHSRQGHRLKEALNVVADHMRY